jgi:hypothetical protein
MRTVNSHSLERLRPKILIYGESGTGKTVTALSLPGRKLVIDGEQGCTAYAGSYDFDLPAGNDGKPLTTDDPQELERIVDDLLIDPGPYTVLVIDPLTTFYTRSIDLADSSLRPRAESVAIARRRELTAYDSAMNPGAWGAIKRHFARLFSKLRRLDMAVIVTCREKTTLEPTPDGGFRKGDAVPDGDAKWRHEFDYVLRLRSVGGARVAYVDKMRDVQQTAASIENFSAARLVELIGADGFTRTAEPRPLISDEQAEMLRGLIHDLGVTPANLARALTKRGANSIDELGPGEAKAMILNLQAEATRRANEKAAAAAAPTTTSQPAATAATAAGE